MRPLATPHGFLRYPLSLVLATEGNVRVLRELVRHGGELNPPALARRTSVSAQHVRQILAGLVAARVVEEVGQGRYLSYRVREDHPLYSALDELFRREEERFQAVLDAVREAVGAEHPEALSVWLYGSVARGEDSVESDVDVAIVTASDEVEPVVNRVRERLEEHGRNLDVQYSVLGLDTDDVLRLSQGDPWWKELREDAFTLLGHDPASLATLLKRARTHATGKAKE